MLVTLHKTTSKPRDSKSCTDIPEIKNCHSPFHLMPFLPAQVPVGSLPFVWLGLGEHHFTPTLLVDSHLRRVYSCWTSETLSWEKSLPVILVGMGLFLMLCHSWCKIHEFSHTCKRGPGLQLCAGFWKMPTKLWMKGSSGFQHGFSPKACRVSGSRFLPASHFIYIHKYIYILDLTYSWVFFFYRKEDMHREEM